MRGQMENVWEVGMSAQPPTLSARVCRLTAGGWPSTSE